MKKIIFGLIIGIISLSGFTVYGMGKVIPKKTPMQNVGNGAYCWTPDGKIAFYRLIDHWIKMEPDPFPGGGGVYDDYEKDDEAFIVVRDPETKEEKVLFKVPYGHSAPHGVRWLDWSGVNNEILLTVFGAAIYAIKANGEGLRMVVPRDDGQGLTFGFKQATWTPDGKSVMCIASIEHEPGIEVEDYVGVYIMDADGRNPRLIISNASAFSLSPDGKQIVYQTVPRRWREGEKEYSITDIYIINTDGTGKRLLLKGGANPIWSPDGKWVLCGTKLITPNGKFVANMYYEVPGSFSRWSPDLKYLLSIEGGIREFKIPEEGVR